MTGKFITFEGCDGSGKTTQSLLLEKKFKELGIPCIFTREPGGTEISEQIRSIILDKTNEEMVWKTEALLYAASRAQLVEEKIRPALQAGINVICDRYIDSTLAYQGYARGLDLQELIDINFFAVGGLKPHLTFLLDISPDTGVLRRSGRVPDRLEKEKQYFHERVREGYLKLAEKEPERFIILSAKMTIDKLHNEITALSLPLVKNKG